MPSFESGHHKTQGEYSSRNINVLRIQSSIKGKCAQFYGEVWPNWWKVECFPAPFSNILSRGSVKLHSESWWMHWEIPFFVHEQIYVLHTQIWHLNLHWVVSFFYVSCVFNSSYICKTLTGNNIHFHAVKKMSLAIPIHQTTVRRTEEGTRVIVLVNWQLLPWRWH